MMIGEDSVDGQVSIEQKFPSIESYCCLQIMLRSTLGTRHCHDPRREDVQSLQKQMYRNVSWFMANPPMLWLDLIGLLCLDRSNLHKHLVTRPNGHVLCRW